MKMPDWGAILNTVRKMVEDIKANAPPPPPAASADLADVLDHINANLPAVITALRAHQGVLTAEDDFLDLLTASGVTWAPKVDSAVLSAPNALNDAQKWLPTILWALTTFAPAPSPSGGMEPNRVLHGRG